MDKDIEKPMTIKDFQEVMIPAMEGVFATKKDLEQFATKKDVAVLHADLLSFKQEARETFATKAELAAFRDESITYFDKILKDLDILMTEKDVANYQKQKERKLWALMINAMRKNNILTPQDIQEIKNLEVF